MKKILLLVALLGTLSFGYSQNQQADRVIKLGVSAKASQIQLTDFYEWRDFLCFEGCSVSGYDPDYSYSVGLAASVNLGKNLEVVTGLEYTQKAYWEEGFDFFFQYRLRRVLKYMEVPALVRYKFYQTETKKVQAYFDLGFNTLININQGKEEFTYEATLKNVGISGQAGIGLAINLREVTIAVGPHFSYALTNFGAKGHDGDAIPDKNILRPYGLGLGVSILR